MRLKAIRQSVFFAGASPKEVYACLMSSRRHAAFTGGSARISAKEGGGFSAYGGGIDGKNVLLVPGRKIVQEWRCEMEGWPRGHYSRATFSIRAEKGGTRLLFSQSGVPAACAQSISGGWREFYWEPMKDYLQK